MQEAKYSSSGSAPGGRNRAGTNLLAKGIKVVSEIVETPTSKTAERKKRRRSFCLQYKVF